MRPEQIQKLTELEEQLVDVFAEECKPEEWPGMKDQQARGDRFWFKKNALATLAIVGRIQTVLREIRVDGGTEQPGKGDPSRDLDEESIEQEAARLEKQGVALLKKHAKRGR